MKSTRFVLMFALLVFVLACESVEVGTYYPSDMARLNQNRNNGNVKVDVQSIIIESGLAKKIENGIPQVKTDSFSTDDEQACYFIKFNNLSGNHIFKWNWIMPDGKPYISSEKSLKEGEYLKEATIYHPISIKKQKAALYPGKWRIDVDFDGKQIDSRSFSIETSVRTKKANLNVYIWDFEKPANWTDDLARRFMDEFKNNIKQINCVTILERAELEKILAHEKMEKRVRDIQDIPDNDLKKLKRYGATSVIFGKIDQDYDGGEIKVSVNLYEFNSLWKGVGVIQMNTYDKINPGMRRKKMEELAEKLCLSLNQ